MTKRQTRLTTDLSRIFVLTYVIGLVLCTCTQPALADIEVTAWADAHCKNDVKDDREDPDVAWAEGNYTINAKARARNKNTRHGPGLSEDSKKSSGTHPKDSLPETPPEVVHENQSASDQYANAYANTLGAVARATGEAYRDNGKYAFSVEAIGKLKARGMLALARATVDDPIVMEWSDTEDHTVVFTLTLEPGSTRSADSSFYWESKLDFDNDGTFDQLFWRLQLGTDPNAPDDVNLILGQDVVVGGGKTKSQIESELNAMADGSDWEVSTDYPIELRYTVSTGQPGAIGISMEGHAEAGVAAPGAYNPYPAHFVTRVDPYELLLIWTPDPCSTQETVYFSDDFNDVNDRQAAAYKGTQFPPDANYYPQVGYLDVNLGTTYYWAIDEILNIDPCYTPGFVWSFTTKTKQAGLPDPPNDSNFITPCPTLTWDPGAWAVEHYVYFDVNEVNVIGRVGPCDVITEPTDESYTPPGPLEWDTEYFWAVDENDVCDVLTPGEVWSFTVPRDPCDGPAWRYEDDTLYAIWAFNDWDTGPNVPADYNSYPVGFYTFEPNCVDGPNAYLADYTPAGGTIRYHIADNNGPGGDGVIRLKHTDNATPGQSVVIQAGIIWYGDSSPHIVLERLTNWGPNPAPPAGWDQPAGSDRKNNYETDEPLFEFELCDGWMYSVYQVEFERGTQPADNIHVVIETSGTFYLDSVVVDAHWYTPPWASGPRPTDGEPDVPIDVCKLVWYPGAYVDDHNVYLSETEALVADACDSVKVGNRQADPCYPDEGIPDECLELKPGTTYYWRVDEVNDACDPCLWPGEVWEFTTIDYVVIDDFETYTSTPELYAVWEDWHTLPLSEQGGEAHLVTEPNHGGAQAMKFYYDTNFGTPVLRRTYSTPQHWNKGGLVALDIWFYGDANELSINPGGDPCFATDLFVTLGDDDDDDGEVDDKCTIYYVADSGGNTGDLIANQWLVWHLSLEDFNDGNNVNPNKIKSIALGITGGTTGQIYFDDIRLYVRRCVPMYAVDISGPEGVPDCFVDYWDLDAMFGDWLVSDTYVQSEALSDANLLVHYAFDPCGPYDDLGNPWDSSGNSYHGIGINEPNIHAGMLTMTGANSVEIGGDFNDINPFRGKAKGGGDFTIAMKFKTAEPSVLFSSCPYDPDVVDPPNDTAPSNHAMHLFIFNPSQADPTPPRISSTEPTVNYDNWYIDAATSYASDSIMDGQWHHVATTYDVDTNDHVVYLDGVPGVVSSFDPNLVNPTTHSIRIGNTRHEIMPWGEGMGSVPMTGDIDEVYVFDRVLSHGEIVNLLGYAPGQWFYVPVPSDAELYADESPGERGVNFKDYAVLMENWLEQRLWP